MNKKYIEEGKVYLGIELGSTRIKAVLINPDFEPIASGDFLWENKLVNGYWTYDLDQVWQGIQSAYLSLKKDVSMQYDVTLKNITSIGVSGMMHGYLAFDQNNNLLVPFRTWRNNKQAQAAKELTERFQYPIPQRWSIAHLYQAILNQEEHVKDIDYLTTLAGYVHWTLTDEQCIGVGEASGMFPIDLKTKDYNHDMIEQFQKLTQVNVRDILPKVLLAGQRAGRLSEQGRKLLDPSGDLNIDIRFCPPEGDAGTGMVATNAVEMRNGVVSAGTSIFGMVVLEHDLKSVHEEIDQVMTPSGNLVAMVHANNCTSDLNAWVAMFKEILQMFDQDITDQAVYEKLYKSSLDGHPSCNGMVSYGYLSGEHITHFEEGKPLFVRSPESILSLANFMRTHLYSALAVLKIGFDILLKDEHVFIDQMLGHGGLFKTKGVGQEYLSAALNTPVSVMKTAGEGGPYGMALLAAYLDLKESLSLEEFLNESVFIKTEVDSLMAEQRNIEGFENYISRYKVGLDIERSAVRTTFDS